jgi:hypothetical protein
MLHKARSNERVLALISQQLGLVSLKVLLEFGISAGFLLLNNTLTAGAKRRFLQVPRPI